MTNCIAFLMFCCLKNFEEVNKNDMNVILSKEKFFTGEFALVVFTPKSRTTTVLRFTESCNFQVQ